MCLSAKVELQGKGHWDQDNMHGLVIIGILGCGILFFLAVRCTARTRPPNALVGMEVVRSENNPLVTFESSGSLAGNINSPSVIRVPKWINAPLGKYYMYFGHHQGRYIRLAYSDALEGPWQIHEPGTLKQFHTGPFSGSIAAPDVHVDNTRKEIRMYFRGGPNTGVAVAGDGMNFTASGTVLGKAYLRAFEWQGAWYAIAKNRNTGWGELLRSPDGLAPFERRGRFIRRMRHAAVLLRGNTLTVFYSRKGDAPERVLAATVSLSIDWREWIESEPIEVIRPEKEYEGTGFPDKPSRYGFATEVRQLRDPCVFEENGKTFLFYTVSGEMGIAVANIRFEIRDARDESI
jgi:hypothetical protein